MQRVTVKERITSKAKKAGKESETLTRILEKIVRLKSQKERRRDINRLPPIEDYSE